MDEDSLPPVLQKIGADTNDADGIDDSEDGSDADVTGVPLQDTGFAAHADAAQSLGHREVVPVSMDQVMADTETKSRRRGNRQQRTGKSRKGKGRLPHDVAKLLGEANMCYVSQDFPEAIRLLEEVVRRTPRVSDPYHTLGLIYEEMEDPKRALECYLIAAYLTGKDVETWKRVATMSRDQGLLEQALYCINRALRLHPTDENAQYTRAAVLVDLGQDKKGGEAYRALLKQRPHDATVAAEIARLCHKGGDAESAITVLEECLKHNMNLDSGQIPAISSVQSGLATASTRDCDGADTQRRDRATEEVTEDGVAGMACLEAQLHLSNILAELYMSVGNFNATIDAIEDVNSRCINSTEQLPLDLAVKCGICKAYIAEMDQAQAHFARLTTEDVALYPDLYLDVAEALLALNLHGRALSFYEQLLSLPEYNQPAIWLKIGRCHLLIPQACRPVQSDAVSAANLAMGRPAAGGIKDHSAAMRYYSKVLQAVPNNSEAAVAVAKMHIEAGRPEKAMSLLDCICLEMGAIDDEVVPSCGDIGADYPTMVPVDIFGLQLTVERAHLLHKFGRYDEFTQVILPNIWRVIGEQMPAKRKRDNMAKEMDLKTSRKRGRRGSELRRDTALSYPSLTDVLSASELLNLGLKTCRVLVKQHKYFLAGKTCDSLLRRGEKWKAARDTDTLRVHESAEMLSVIPYREDEVSQLRLLSVGVAFMRDDFPGAMSTIRSVCSLQPYSTVFWNLFNMLVSSPQCLGAFEKSHKYLVRLLIHFEDSVPLMILVGHQCGNTRNFGLAIAQYLRAYRLRPTEPLINLCLGVAYLSQVMQKNTFNRHQTCLRAFTFMNQYADLRRSQHSTLTQNASTSTNTTELTLRQSLRAQEASYNLGRAFQQLALNNLAANLYEETLAEYSRYADLITRIPVTAAGVNESAPAQRSWRDTMGLRRDAAYNLVQIYRHSSPKLARHVMREHLLIA